MKFSVVITQRETNPYAKCFEDVAAALSATLRELGHETVHPDQGGRYIIFGANNAFPVESPHPIPDDAIIFNAEQMAAFGDKVESQMWNFKRWRKHVIWDYSSENARRLREAGAERVVHCPIGYHPRMEYIEPAPEEDIDVLFYGSVNPRRREILEALDDRGHKVVALFGAFGKERDEAIARAKVVLNLHYYERAIFEIFRVSHLVANKKCVVSEDGGTDEELERIATRICDVAPRERLVQQVEELLRDANLRRGLAETAYRAFKSMPFIDYVREALAAS